MTSSTGPGASGREPWLARLLTPRSAPLHGAPQPAPVSPGAEAAALGDGPIGVLLCHGFTGSPLSLRPWAEQLAAAGFRVRLPRLPGHGTDWREMNITAWSDWYSCVEDECRTLLEECSVVVVAGLSMGGALALLLAARFGDRIAGVVLVNPSVASADRRMAAIPLLSRFVPSIAAIGDDIARPGVTEGAYPRTPLRALASMIDLWRQVSTELPEVKQPVLLFVSDVDHVVDPSSAKLILRQIGSTDVTRTALAQSYHVATLDYDTEQIFTESAAFFRRVAQPQDLPSGLGAER